MNRGEKEKNCDTENSTIFRCEVQEPDDIPDKEEDKCPVRKDSMILNKKRMSKDLKLDAETMVAVEKRFNELRVAKAINEYYDNSPLDISIPRLSGYNKNDHESNPKRRTVVFMDELQAANANLMKVPVTGPGKGKSDEMEVKLSQ